MQVTPGSQEGCGMRQPGGTATTTLVWFQLVTTGQGFFCFLIFGTRKDFLQALRNTFRARAVNIPARKKGYNPKVIESLSQSSKCR